LRALVPLVETGASTRTAIVSADFPFAGPAALDARRRAACGERVGLDVITSASDKA
jgi:hypothetical protein